MKKPKTSTQKKKRFIAMARVRSREQEREGFSLDIQVDALNTYPGTHKPLVDRVNWDMVQVLLGEKVYRSHELTYASGLILCNHFNSVITGVSVVKKSTVKEYVNYRCSQHTAPGHPRIRLSEEEIDQQMMSFFNKMQVENNDVREWFTK